MARRPPAHGVILVNEAGDEYSAALASSPIPAGTATIGAVNALNGAATTPANDLANASFIARPLDNNGVVRSALAVAPWLSGGPASAPVWSPECGTIEGVVLASSAKTAAQSVDFVNRLPGASLHIIINVTAGSGFSLTPAIRARDPIATTEYYTLLTGAAIVANGRTVLRVGPGIAITANLSASDLVPRNLNFQMAVADATSATYSVAYVLA